MTTSSATPLAAKLGIREGSSLVLLHEPVALSLELPPGVRVRRRVGGRADVVLAFFTDLGALEGQVGRLGGMVFPAGGLWVAWPKRSSGLGTDVTDDGVRRMALPLGLVDNKVCAVDATWTGLRLVWRKEAREGRSPVRKAPGMGPKPLAAGDSLSSSQTALPILKDGRQPG